MKNQASNKIKKTLTILLAVLFLAPITATAVSATQKEYNKGDLAGYTAGYKAGVNHAEQSEYGAGWSHHAHSAKKAIMLEDSKKVSKMDIEMAQMRLNDLNNS